MKEYICLKFKKGMEEKGIGNVLTIYSKKERGFFQFGIAFVVILMLIILFLSFQNVHLNWVVYSCFLLFGIIIFEIIYMERLKRKYLKELQENYIKKIDFLYTLLSTEYHIKSLKQLDELIKSYQDYLQEEKELMNKRRKIIFFALSAFGGVATLSFTNLDIIGIDFGTWLQIVVIVLVSFFFSAIIMWMTDSLNITKENYTLILSYLKDLKIIKYDQLVQCVDMTV